MSKRLVICNRIIGHRSIFDMSLRRSFLPICRTNVSYDPLTNVLHRIKRERERERTKTGSYRIGERALKRRWRKDYIWLGQIRFLSSVQPTTHGPAGFFRKLHVESLEISRLSDTLQGVEEDLRWPRHWLRILN